MIMCELLSHVYFAAPPLRRTCAYIDSLGKFGFRAQSGLQKQMSVPAAVRACDFWLGLGPGFKMRPIYDSDFCIQRRPSP